MDKGIKELKKTCGDCFYWDRERVNVEMGDCAGGAAVVVTGRYASCEHPKYSPKTMGVNRQKEEYWDACKKYKPK